MYKLRNLPLNMLMHCVTLACACNCINFGLLCSGVSGSLTAAVVSVTVFVWSFLRACAVKWMQGRPEVAQLCGCSAESDSAGKNFKESGVWSVFHFFLISAFAFSLFWIPSLCSHFISMHSFSLVSLAIIFIYLCVSPSFLFYPIFCQKAVGMLLQSIHTYTYRQQQRIETILWRLQRDAPPLGSLGSSSLPASPGLKND